MRRIPDRFSWRTKARSRPSAHAAPSEPFPPDLRAWRSALQNKKVLGITDASEILHQFRGAFCLPIEHREE
jgi:hypothetical protein